MRHIGNRALQIPPNIDVLYCEQEVGADERSALQTVLDADVKRTELLEECKRLETEQEAGEEKIKLVPSDNPLVSREGRGGRPGGGLRRAESDRSRPGRAQGEEVIGWSGLQ